MSRDDAGPRDDATLLAAHAAGDTDAFAELVLRHKDRLWAVALRTMGDPDEAADALQDALLSAHRAAASFRGDAQVTTWLHRVVVNACLDRLRRAKTRPTVPLPEHDSSHPIEPTDPLAQRELAWEIQQALATLPPDQRAALVLVDVEGYPVEQVAVMLDCPTGTVKSRCARGRAKLIPLLAHLRNPEPMNDVLSTQPRDPTEPNGAPGGDL